MSDEQLDPEERRLADLFGQVEAPTSMRRWDGAAPGAAGGARRAAWWARPFLALVTAGGERRLRPLAAALVLPLLMLVIGGGLQLRAHFTGGSGGDGATPPARYAAAMAFDAAHGGQVVLFGGRTADGSVLGDTWTWDGSSWTQQHPRQSPPARGNAAMAFDAAHGVVVLYGGSGGQTRYPPLSSQPQLEANPEQETWTWDGSNWHQVSTGHRPDGQVIGMAYDEKRSQLLLVNRSYGMAMATAGGGAVFHGTNHSVPVPAPLPTPVSTSATAVGEASGGSFSLQQGPAQSVPAQPVQANSVPQNPGPPTQVVPVPMPPVQVSPPEQQTWTWTGSDWKRLASTPGTSGFQATSPPAWDDAAKRVVMLSSDDGGGCVASTQWQVIQDVHAPGVVSGTAGSGGASRSAGWSGYAPLPAASAAATPGAIVPTSPPTSVPVPQGVHPCVTMGEGSIGSPTSGVHCSGCPMAHQVSWDGSAWRETALGNGVAILGAEQLVADPATGRLIAVDSERTWTWNGSKWTQHLNPTGLRQRGSFALAADTAHHVVVLFGGRPFGNTQNTAAADTWTWNGTAWTHVAGTVPPPAETFSLHAIPPTMIPVTPPVSACAPQVNVDPGADGSVSITLSPQPNTADCVAGLTATVTLLDGSGVKQLNVAGNGIPVPAFTTTLVWTNWCGKHLGSVEVRMGDSTTGESIDHFPTCTNHALPSNLSLGSGGHAGVAVP